MKLVILLVAMLALAFTASAGAMWGQTFQSGMTIMPDGSLTLAGPVGFNESDEVGAVVSATVVQQGAKAEGVSQYVERTNASVCPKNSPLEPNGCARQWMAPMTTTGTFHTGKASAKMVATVYHVDGTTEKYSWSLQVSVVAK